MATKTASLLLFCITPPGDFTPLLLLFLGLLLDVLLLLGAALLLQPSEQNVLLSELLLLLLQGVRPGCCHRNFSGRPHSFTSQSSTTCRAISVGLCKHGGNSIACMQGAGYYHTAIPKH
jgi:hypothetical protein